MANEQKAPRPRGAWEPAFPDPDIRLEERGKPHVAGSDGGLSKLEWATVRLFAEQLGALSIDTPEHTDIIVARRCAQLAALALHAAAEYQQQLLSGGGQVDLGVLPVGSILEGAVLTEVKVSNVFDQVCAVYQYLADTRQLDAFKEWAKSKGSIEVLDLVDLDEYLRSDVPPSANGGAS